MTEQWFLEIDGIVGASTADEHAGEIDVLSWSWGIARSGSSGVGSGSGSVKAKFEDLHVVARIDVASPHLIIACATGEHFETAVLTGARGTGKGKTRDFLTYAFSDVTVTSIEHGDADRGSPIEQFALGYRTMELTYVPQKSSGKLGTPIHVGFDVGKNKKL